MFKSRNTRGFTLAELAASLGVFALAATILTPAFVGTPAISGTTVTVSQDGSAAGKSPFTPAVDAIIITVRDSSTGLVSKTERVENVSSNTATITGLQADKNYTFEVSKENAVGTSPAAVAEVVYKKDGTQTTTNWTDFETRNDGAPQYRAGDDIKEATKWEQKFDRYGTKSITVPAYTITTIQWHTTYIPRTREVRISPMTKQVRIAPFTRSVRVAPFERTNFVPASSYTYSCTKSRNESYQCGTTSYTYTGTCTSTRPKSYACGTNPTYSYACGSNPTYSYSCGSSCSGSGRNRRCSTRYCTGGGGTKYCTGGGGTKYCTVNESYTHSCQKTGTEPRYCTRSVSYQDTCTGTKPASTTTTTLFNYADEAVYNYRTDPVFNYVTESYTETDEYGRTTESTSGLSEGTCASKNLNPGHKQGMRCNTTHIHKTVTDFNNRIYVDDKSKPTAWKVVGKKPDVFLGYAAQTHAIPRSMTVDNMKGLTVNRAVKAAPGQLLLDASSVKTVNRFWKEATVAAAGTGSNKAVGSTVKFTRGQEVILNGKQYIAVASAVTR